jgi:hypothetical protein
MNKASKIIIGSGTPSNHKSAPRPKPMTTSVDLVKKTTSPPAFKRTKLFAIGYRIIIRMMRLIGTPSNQSRIGIAFSCYSVWCFSLGVRRSRYLPRYHSLFRKLPPSTAARLAAKAPASMEAANQSENLAADLRAWSAAVLAWVVT